MELVEDIVSVQKRQNISDEEDAGVCLASVSSSSPASSRGLNSRRCRSVCVGDMPAFHCEKPPSNSTVPLIHTNSSTPVAISTPEAIRKSKSDISSSCILNPNNYVPIYNKNSANNIRESNKRKEVIRPPRPASCTFGLNGGENGTLEGKQMYEQWSNERSFIQLINRMTTTRITIKRIFATHMS